MKIRYIIQARFKSTRLPEKISQQIGEKILIQHIIDRLLTMGAEKSEIILALADEKYDKLDSFLEKINIPYVLGSVHNVLLRYVEASADLAEDDLIVRLTGDNPFLDFKCLEDNIRICKENSAIDYSYPYKLPLGMGYEIIRKKALNHQLGYELKPHHLEHVTTFIKENTELFIIRQIDYFINSTNVRLTIDYEEDLEQARKTYEYFSALGNPYFCSTEIYNLQERNHEFFDKNRLMMQKKPTDYEKETKY